MAGGSQESHLTIKQTDNVRLLVLLLLLLLHYYYYYFHTSISTLSFTHPLNQLNSLTGLGLDQFGGVTVVRWFSFDCFLLAISIHLPLPTRDQAQDAPREKFSLSEVSAHNLDRREWRKMSQPDLMGLTDPNLPIICPFRLYRGFGFPFLASSLVTSCHLPLGFPFSARTASFTAVPRLDVYLVCFTCLPGVDISLFHRVFFTTSLSWVAASSARQTGLTKMEVGNFHFRHRTLTVNAVYGDIHGA